MHFAFTEQDDELRQAVAAVLAATCPPAVVRAAWDAAPGELDRGVWEQLTEMGVAAMLLPEEHGGLGLDERSLAQVLEEIGYSGVPLPIVESVLLAPTLVAPAMVGDLFASDLGGPHVAAAADADHLLLTADDGSVHLVGAGQVAVRQRPSTDAARRLADVDWTPTAATLLCDRPDTISLAVDRATFGTAALIVGLLQRTLDLTVGYVKDRHQFGVPIGSFQAVKHHLADAHMTLAFARPAVHRAAWSLATGDAERRKHVALAKLLANQAAAVVTRHALQCHGAIGYTVEYDLHLFVKRAWALSAEWGSTRQLRSRLAHELGVTGG